MVFAEYVAGEGVRSAVPLRVTRTVQGVRAAPVHDTLTGHVTIVVDDVVLTVSDPLMSGAEP